jgi:hypothetical protein
MLLAAVSLAGCATVGEGPAGDQPEAREVEPQADPEPPDLSLEERWEEPFAVLSSGRPAAHRDSVAARPSTGGETGDAADTLRTHRVEWGETWFGIARRYGISGDLILPPNEKLDRIARVWVGSELLLEKGTLPQVVQVP